MISAILNTIGLVLDIAGVWLLAYEVIKNFSGSEFKRDILPVSTVLSPRPPLKSEEFKRWQKRRVRNGWIGLAFLTIGFSLQILSNWT